MAIFSRLVIGLSNLTLQYHLYFKNLVRPKNENWSEHRVIPDLKKKTGNEQVYTLIIIIYIVLYCFKLLYNKQIVENDLKPNLIWNVSIQLQNKQYTLFSINTNSEYSQ